MHSTGQSEQFIKDFRNITIDGAIRLVDGQPGGGGWL